MPEPKNFVKYDIDLREWINKLYADIEYMRNFIDNHNYNLTRADLDLSNHYRNNDFSESSYQQIELEVIFDSENHFVDFLINSCSQSLIEENFFTNANVKGSPVSEIIHDPSRKFFRFMEKSFKQQRTLISEFYHPEMECAFKVITQPVSQRHLTVYLENITSEKLYHLNVKRYENLFSKAQEISSSGFFQFRTDNQELYVTDGILNIFGCSKSPNMTRQINLKDYLSCVHDDDKELVLSIISDETLSSSFDYQHRIMVHDKIKYINIKASAFYDPIDESISLIGTVDDITSRQTIEEDLKEKAAILSEIEEISQIAYWKYDFNSNQFCGSRETQKILGISDNNFVISFGDFLKLLAEDDQQRFYELYHQRLAQHRDWESDFHLIDRFGVEKDVQIICHNYFDEHGKPTHSKGFICNNTDFKQYKNTTDKLNIIQGRFTDLQLEFNRRLQEELKEIRAQDKYQIQKYKHTALSDLLSFISREWLGSLTVLSTQIHNCHESFEFGELTEEKFKSMHEDIQSHIKKMISRLQRLKGYYPPRERKSIFKISTVINNLKNSLIPIFQEQGATLEVELTDDHELTGDISKFLETLMAIIKNSQEEFIKREIDNPCLNIKGYKTDKEYILEIFDNAGGISEGIINRIFEPYFSSPEKTESTGLGLYLSKMVIEKALNGKLTAQNHNTGASFKIELPLS